MRDNQNYFGLGELSPRMNGRSDSDAYFMGVRPSENFIFLPQGPADARPGTIRIDDFDEPTKAHRIVPMAIDHDTTILLAINDEKVYAYSLKQDGTHVSAVPIVDGVGDKLYAPIKTNEEDLWDLQFKQYESQMFVSHPNYDMKVISFDEVNMKLTISGFVAKYRKFDDSGALTYDANDVLYHEGKLYRALIDIATPATNIPSTNSAYYQSVSSRSPILEGESTTYTSLGAVDVAGNAIPAWVGTETVPGTLVCHNERVWGLGTRESADKDGDYISWYYPEPLPTRRDDNDNVVIAWDQCDGRLLKVKSYLRKADHPTDPSGKAWLHIVDLPPNINTLPAFVATSALTEGTVFHDSGFVYVVTADTPATPPRPTEDVVSDWVYLADAPNFASEGAYPNYVVFHDRRLWILGTRNKPGMMYASKIGKIHDFTIGQNADDGMQISLGTEVAELPSWAKSRRDLIIGSAKSEWVLSGGDSPITPQSVFAFPQSRAGSMRDGAIDISDMMLFFQKGGRRLLRFVFSNDTQSYSTPDMTQLAEHMFEAGVKEFALQSNPDFILWCVMKDGTLVGGTYDPQSQTIGWHRHNTDGEFESVCVTSTPNGEDEVWFAVRRDTPSGGSTRQLERFAFRKQAEGQEMIYVDDAEVVAINDGVGYVSADKYGATLTALYGGAAHPNVVAEEDGKITMQNDLFTTAIVGREYLPKIRPQKIYPSGSKLDTGIRISRVGIRVYRTLGLQVGADEDHLDPVIFRTTGDIMGQPPPLYSGEVEMSIDSSFGDEDWMVIVRDQPFPCMILGITYEMEAGRI